MQTLAIIEPHAPRTPARLERPQRRLPGWAEAGGDESAAFAGPAKAAEQPLARVAALLVSISHNNAYEGRDPSTIPDALTSGFVADLLGVDIGTLAGLLVDLRRRGLVDSNPSEPLRLKDIPALETLADQG